jgi:hypothetical protein
MSWQDVVVAAAAYERSLQRGDDARAPSNGD